MARAAPPRPPSPLNDTGLTRPLSREMGDLGEGVRCAGVKNFVSENFSKRILKFQGLLFWLDQTSSFSPFQC